MIQRIGFLISLCMLSACSTLNGDFSCGVGKGVGCTPIDEVNQMVDEGVLSSDTVSSEAVIPALDIASVSSAISELDPVRLPEQTQRVYIAPYTDVLNDNYHSGRFVYTVVRKSRWL